MKRWASWQADAETEIRSLVQRYNALGDASTSANIDITGAGTRQVCIENSGYAHAC